MWWMLSIECVCLCFLCWYLVWLYYLKDVFFWIDVVDYLVWEVVVVF